MDNWRYVEAKRKLAFFMALLIFILAIPSAGITATKVLAEEAQGSGANTLSDNEGTSSRNAGDTSGNEGDTTGRNGEYTVTIQQSGAGTVSPNDISEISESITVSAGDSLTVVLLPDIDKQLSVLKVNGQEKVPADCSGLTDENGHFNGKWQYTLSNISENMTVEAVFGDIQENAVSLEDAGIRLLYTDGTEIAKIDNNFYLKDSTIKISAAADKLIKLQNNDSYSSEIQLCVNQSATLETLYRCERNPVTFGTEEKLVLTDRLNMIVDQGAPTLALDKNVFWKNADCETITVSGKITDDMPDRVVWFSEAPGADEAEKVLGETTNIAPTATDGSFSVADIALDSDKKTNTFYFYAVDKAGQYSAPCEVNVYKDGDAPVISKVETVGLKETPFGNFGKKDAALLLTVGDVSGGDCNSSGVEKIEIYAGNDVAKAYTKKLSGTSPDELMQEVRIAISRDDLQLFTQLKELKMKVTDRVGNVSGEYTLSSLGLQSGDVMLENDAPMITVTVPHSAFKDEQNESNIKYWYRTIPSVEYAVTDMLDSVTGSGLAKRTVMLNGEELVIYCGAYEDTDYASVKQEDTRTVSANDLSGMVNGENILKIYYEDYAGNHGEAEQAFYLDNQKPQVTEFLIEKESSLLDKVLSFLSFGTYSNSKVKITVTADDTMSVLGNNAAASGVNQITLYLNGKAYETKSVTADNQAVFVLPGEEILEGNRKVYLNTKVSATATDKVGNSSEVMNMTTDNSNLRNSNLMIETVEPLVDIVLGTEAYVNGEGVVYHNSDVEFNIQTKDVDSGLGRVGVKINDTTLVDNTYIEQRIQEDSFEVSTADVSGNDNGLYDLTVRVEDNAGTVISETRKVYKDETAPEIIKIEMEAAGTGEADGTTLSYTEQDYGYYFHEATTVTIYGADGKETGGSGVKTIEYYLVGVTGKVGNVVSKTVDQDEKITFVIPAQFKGQIYTRAYDNVENVPAEYVTPSGLIIETPEQHAKEEHIVLNKEGASYQDNEGKELYAEDVNVTIGIMDTYSGIRSVEWKIEAPYDTGANQQGTLTIDNQGNFTSDSNADGWNKTKTEKNLVTNLEKTISVTNNSNNIVVSVKMTDRAGNTSEKNITFSIDKTQPEIALSFDVQETMGGYEQIFNRDRVATITVRERNFNAEDITATITNTDGNIPDISGWSISENVENPDENVQTATITFSADGDYTLEVGGHDRAGHTATNVKAQDFTIDRTLPVISVTYDAENGLNGKYHPTVRTATIRIEEHNFANEQVRINGTATDAGNVITFPQASTFNVAGDVHTATITCGSDGLYRFDVEYTDKAGNVAEVYVGEEYYVDMTAPTIEITGVENMSANNGEVIPQILLSDTNYDPNGVLIELTGANLGRVELQGSYTEQGFGQIFTFSDFPREKINDDIYTLTATLRDMAGNESTEMITFSVNRFGSVYVLDDSLKEIAGTYIAQEIDVKLTEINVDNLEHDKIKVVVDANGNPQTLTEGEDYTVKESGGNGSWYQYDYVIDKSLFAGDGRYIVTLYSVDAAGNINENVDESKKAEISFGVDKTAPMVIPIDIESETQYAVDVKTATVAVNDNLVLGDVDIYIGEEKCDYVVEGENYTFDIPSATVRQDVTVAARDAAGNQTNYVISGVLVTTNAFIRWYNNTPLFVGSLLGTAVVSGGGVGMFVTLRKRRLKISK